MTRAPRLEWESYDQTPPQQQQQQQLAAVLVLQQRRDDCGFVLRH
jgi:hypothetical protein